MFAGGAPDPFERLIGSSPSMRALRETIRLVGPTDSTVLVCGETGTGKELVAELLHHASARRDRALVCLNCAAVPDTLLESELFGVERGAFTGAFAARSGAFERAHHGTLFLDEIGDMSPLAQAKILRALESKSVQRLGGNTAHRSDARIVAATNWDLRALVVDGRFRKDLYYRLNVVRLVVPRLAERKEDILLLATSFAKSAGVCMGRRVDGLASAAVPLLLNHDWPGNVRELKNLMEGTVATLRGTRIEPADLPQHFLDEVAEGSRRPDEERDRLIAALLETNWNKSQAASRLRWSRMTIYRKMAKYQLVRPEKSRVATLGARCEKR